MKYFRIATQPEISWGLFSDDDVSFCCSNGSYIASTLSVVRDCFLDVFGADVVNAHPTLAIIPTTDVPMTFREYNLIALSSKGRYYLQHIYQFSHELCHFMVPDAVCMPHRWFEETLCETMSWYALNWISKNRDRYHAYPFFSLIEGIDSYIFNAQANRIYTNDPIPVFLSHNLTRLKSDCFNRPLNNTFAYSIYPIFLQSPILWNIVPHLHTINSDVSFHDALVHILQAGSVPQDLGDQFIKALCE